MPDRIRVKLVPTIVHLTPSVSGDGTFTSASAPSKSKTARSFPVVIGVQVSLEDRGSGVMPPPLVANSRPRATLEILARQRDTANPQAPYTLCGTFGGQMSLVGPARTPKFVSKRPNPANSTVVADFRSAKEPTTPPVPIPDVMARSDWSLPLSVDQSTVEIAGSDKLLSLPIPWIFNANDPNLQLNARLTVAGVLETDATGLAGNMPIDIPLQHDKVPDEAVKGKPKEHPVLTYFGVHSLTTMSLDGGARTGFSSAGLTLNVFIDDSVLALVPAANTGQMRGHVLTVLRAAGFAAVNVELAGPPAPTPPGTPPLQTVRTRFAALFVQGRATPSESLWFMSSRVPAAKRNAMASDMEANRTIIVLAGETVSIPFFDFYICAQNADPPRNEVGHSEILDRVVGANPRATPPVVATKNLLAPIVLTAGTNNLSGLRKLKTGLSGEQVAQLIASTIVHEIGHTLGLRHALSFAEALPYVFADTQCRSVMGSAVPPSGPMATPPAPFEFFSPVQTEAIRQNYL